MEKTRTSAYHPQVNGQVEGFNQTVEVIVAKTVKENQTDWDLCFQKVLCQGTFATYSDGHDVVTVLDLG